MRRTLPVVCMNIDIFLRLDICSCVLVHEVH